MNGRVMFGMWEEGEATDVTLTSMFAQVNFQKL